MCKRHYVPCVVLLAFGAAAFGQQLPKDTLYEFRGQVLQSDGKPFRGLTPLLFLEGATSPFVTQTQADPGGNFKFPGLRPAMYVLTILVPLRGEMNRSIEVGPAGADSKGRIEQTFHFEAQELGEERTVISARQLSVPDQAQREYDRARQCLEKHDVLGARRHLEEAVRLAPQFAIAWNHLGTIAYQSREYATAEQYFRKALELEPTFYAPLVNLGGALNSQGKAQEAIEVNTRAVKVAPQDALAQSQLGLAYFLAGQFEEAEKYLKRAKTLDPRHFSLPQLVLAEIYRLQKRLHECAAELDEFLRYHPDSPAAPRVRQLLKSPAPTP